MNELIALLRELNPNIDFANGKALVSGGEIDSIDIVEIIDIIETHYNIHLSGSDIDPDNFEDVDKIYSMITKYI